MERTSALTYEDTVRAEREPCDVCGILVDEADACYLGEVHLCADCCNERLDEMERALSEE